MNICSFCYGFSIGWISPSLETLKSVSSPLEGGPITLNEIALLGVLPSVGALFGTILVFVLSNVLGRITPIISLLAFPNLVMYLWKFKLSIHKLIFLV